MGAHFTARFDSDCESCGNPIYEGDQAGYVDDEVCCQDCWEAAQDDEQTGDW